MTKRSRRAYEAAIVAFAVAASLGLAIAANWIARHSCCALIEQYAIERIHAASLQGPGKAP